MKTYIPEFTGDGREQITVRELLTHTSGLPPDIETKTDWHGWDTAIKMACTITLESPPGTVFRYSDINFILLGEIVQRVSKMPLQDFVQTRNLRAVENEGHGIFAVAAGNKTVAHRADGSGERQTVARHGS